MLILMTLNKIILTNDDEKLIFIYKINENKERFSNRLNVKIN